MGKGGLQKLDSSIFMLDPRFMFSSIMFRPVLVGGVGLGRRVAYAMQALLPDNAEFIVVDSNDMVIGTTTGAQRHGSIGHYA